jgi:hypothetical protein
MWPTGVRLRVLQPDLRNEDMLQVVEIRPRLVVVSASSAGGVPWGGPVALSPDGSKVAMTRDRKHIEVWSVRRSRVVLRVPAVAHGATQDQRDAEVKGIVWDPLGQRLAYTVAPPNAHLASHQPSVGLYGVNARREVALWGRYDGYGGYPIGWSPVEDTIVLRLWNARAHGSRLVAVGKGHTDQIEGPVGWGPASDAVWHPSGRRFSILMRMNRPGTEHTAWWEIDVLDGNHRLVTSKRVLPLCYRRDGLTVVAAQLDEEHNIRAFGQLVLASGSFVPLAAPRWARRALAPREISVAPHGRTLAVMLSGDLSPIHVLDLNTFVGTTITCRRLRYRYPLEMRLLDG